MKILILILVVLLNNIVSAQRKELSEYQKNTIIANLDSTTRYKKLNAILDVWYMYVPEAIPKIEQDIFKQQQDIAHWYLVCLDKYNSPNFIDIAHRYIDTITFLNYTFEPENINEQKADAIAMLVRRGDYSRVGFLFEYIDLLKPAVASTPFNILNLIVENVPEYSELAKAEFRRIALNSNHDYYAPMSLLFLVDYYGDEIIPDLVYIIYNSQLSQVKSIAYDELEERNYPEMEAITKYLFLNEKEYKTKWINKLITKYATPSNYKFLQDNYQNIIVPEWLPAYQEYFQKTKLSNPLYPPSFNNLFEQFDYFKNLCDSLFNYTWLGDLTLSNELKNILTTAKTNLQNGDSLTCRVQIKEFQDLVDNVYKDSLNTDPRFVTIEGWKFLYWNAQYILDRLPEPQTNPNLLVNLKNSLGKQIPASNVMYYEGSWKDAVNNGDGTFTVITTTPTVSIRMFYEYANQTVNNVPAQNNTYTFTTVNTAVQLKNSSGNLIDEGTVQYYAGAWRSFGTTINGVAYKELLPVNYSFRMTYEYVLNDKQQNLSENPVVDFNTVLCTIKVTNVNSQPLEGANIKYYSIAWRDIGLTNSSGEITKELLPKNLSFRATYNNVSQDKQQDISVNNLVEIMLNVP
jgi:hypothetical protein